MLPLARGEPLSSWTITNLGNVIGSSELRASRKENIPVYIGKFFGRNKDAADSLIALMKENDVIAKNLAPYPSCTALLCLLWRESSVSKRQIIGRLQTFSQLFQEIVSFLIDHYFSKDIKSFTCGQLDDFYSRISGHLRDIGKPAFEGLQQNQLSLPEQSFSHCKEGGGDGMQGRGYKSRKAHYTKARERKGKESDYDCFVSAQVIPGIFGWYVSRPLSMIHL